MKTDQFDYTDDDVMLARCVSMLVERLYDKEGNPVDIADKKGREALKQTIDRFPKEISVNLREEDKKLLRTAIEECQETRKVVKSWFWWIVGAMFLSSATMTLCAVMMLR